MGNNSHDVSVTKKVGYSRRSLLVSFAMIVVVLLASIAVTTYVAVDNKKHSKATQLRGSNISDEGEGELVPPPAKDAETTTTAQLDDVDLSLPPDFEDVEVPSTVVEDANNNDGNDIADVEDEVVDNELDNGNDVDTTVDGDNGDNEGTDNLSLPTEFEGFDPTETSEGPWPSCMGKDSDICKEWIVYLTLPTNSLQEDNIHIIPQDAYVSMDYDTERVRIFMNTKTNLVVRVPRRG